MNQRTIALLLGLLLLGMHVAARAKRIPTRRNGCSSRKSVHCWSSRCYKCHSAMESKGGLRLDSRAALLNGGETGAAVVVGKPDESLLLEAVRHQNGLAMPPDGKLSEIQILALTDWIKTGAIWPGEPTVGVSVATPGTNSIVPTLPNDGELAEALQLWLRADSLGLSDGAPIYVWPDQSGHARDLTITAGVRNGGVGQPPRFARESTLLRRFAAHFEPGAGMASSPDHPVAIHGDAALTVMLVMNLQPHDDQPMFDGVVGIGNPASIADPGRPLAAVVQINRGEDSALHFAGGFNHDASYGQGSFKPYYGKTILLSITKQPGPMRSTTRLFINGEPAIGPNGEAIEGTDSVLELEHRTDIGVFLGKALGWNGSIRGDLGEVLVYNRALTDTQRLNVESYLAEKFGLLLKPVLDAIPRVEFTPEEKSYWAYQPVKAVTPPTVSNEDWIKSPIDRFVLQQLEARGLKPAQP